MQSAVYVLILCCFIAQASGEEFHIEVNEEVFKKLEIRYPATKACIEEAKAMGQWKGGKNGPKKTARKTEEVDKNAAIALINLYSQACLLTTDANTMQEKFYVALKREVRSGNPTDFWAKTRTLIDKAVDVLKPTLHTALFRGHDALNPVPKKGDNFAFGITTSATENSWIAITYNKESYFVICEAQGVKVSSFSAFPQQAEVVLKSTAKYKVLKVSADLKKNENLLKAYGNVKFTVPKYIIGIKMVSSRRKRAPGGSKESSRSSGTSKAGTSKVGQSSSRTGPRSSRVKGGGIKKKKTTQVKKNRFTLAEERAAAKTALITYFC